VGRLWELLQYPGTKGMDLDDPETTSLRREIILQKPILNSIYREWYSRICDHLPDLDGPVLELGSGAGFLSTYIPGLITSDVIPISEIDLICEGQRLPFNDCCLRSVVLINVLHHVRDPLFFFKESKRCIKKGGRIVLIEPWVTSWSRIIYGKIHHEPFDPASPSWNLPESGPLSGGNDALPWIIFKRDIKAFQAESDWQLVSIEEIMPFRYLLSGGVSMRSLVPAWMNRPLAFLEGCMPDRMTKATAMFAVIVLK